MVLKAYQATGKQTGRLKYDFEASSFITLRNEILDTHVRRQGLLFSLYRVNRKLWEHRVAVVNMNAPGSFPKVGRGGSPKICLQNLRSIHVAILLTM